MNSNLEILNTPYPLILFDGVCNLCNSSVQFVIKRDPQKKFRFASLQSNLGQKIQQTIGMTPSELHTMILIEQGKVYLKSSATLNILKRMSGLWPLLFGFIITPPFIRNWVYDFVAKHRYRWFGKKQECWIPTPELKERFLE